MSESETMYLFKQVSNLKHTLSSFKSLHRKKPLMCSIVICSSMHKLYLTSILTYATKIM